jgi:hypothetical protein
MSYSLYCPTPTAQSSFRPCQPADLVRWHTMHLFSSPAFTVDHSSGFAPANALYGSPCSAPSAPPSPCESLVRLRPVKPYRTPTHTNDTSPRSCAASRAARTLRRTSPSPRPTPPRSRTPACSGMNRIFLRHRFSSRAFAGAYATSYYSCI